MPNTSNLRIQDILRKCNLLEYYERFISEGFDQLESLLDVTEADLIAMDVKRGHRRRLQREIITIRGIPPSLPIPIPIRSGLGSQLDGQLHSNNGMSTPYITPFVPPNVNCPAGSLQQKNEVSKEYDLTGSNITKRKYCRHPKQDKNAPVKPPSAYVMFAHKVRETYQGKGISFADMAKIVGDHWKNIPPKEKEEMEITALKAKEEYQIALSEYKTTKQWKQYQEYLKNFKETNEQSSRKKPKTETLNNETTFSSYSRPNSNFGYPLPFSTTYSSEDVTSTRKLLYY